MNYGNFDFDTEFMTEEEVEEAIDAIVHAVGEQIEQEERKTAIINPTKLKQIAFTYKALRYMTKAKVTYKLHEPYRSMGSVSVVGKNISFSHPEWFRGIAEMASNVEIYPKTDGTVQMTFTFHGLVNTIE